jgi:hypothetical protein
MIRKIRLISGHRLGNAAHRFLRVMRNLERAIFSQRDERDAT